MTAVRTVAVRPVVAMVRMVRSPENMSKAVCCYGKCGEGAVLVIAGGEQRIRVHVRVRNGVPPAGLRIRQVLLPHRPGRVNMPDMNTNQSVEVIVIGGGAAGLSGALTLARARRSVMVIDSGEPRNAPASGVHGFLSRDGMPPRDLVARGQEEVARYGGSVVPGRVVSAEHVDGLFEVTTETGERYSARRLLVATGLTDELPEVPGLAERWGRDVLHCPYCHGWEIRDQPLGVLGTGPMSVHQALLFRQWTSRITLFTADRVEVTDDQREQLTARGVDVVEGAVAAIEVDKDRLTGIRLASGRVVEVTAVALSPRMRAGKVLSSLGLDPVEHPMGVGEHIEADATGRTAVPGVWVAGNATDLAAQVVGAAAAGTVSAAAINADLVAEDTSIAVAALRRAQEGRERAESQGL
ncbi:NAD(P)/FAD-dependent oxidoreductase [Streptomyces sp. NBC_01020]|uniref:NAD(P)/FAD-dependent oxidoreductase n=1 Tax=Streptomyces sp. NBC_01020 TaxID=2903722 RepID=UPI00386F3678